MVKEIKVIGNFAFHFIVTRPVLPTGRKKKPLKYLFHQMRYLPLLLVTCLLLAGFTPPRLKSVKLGPGVSISMPSDFQVMPDEVIATKYPAPRKPLGAFSSPNGQADLIVSERPSTFSSADLNMLQQFYRSTITSKYSEVNFIRQEVKEIKGQQYLIFEFTSLLRDENQGSGSRLAPIRKYTLLQYTLVRNSAQPEAGKPVRDKDKATSQDRLLVFTFTTPLAGKDVWQETAHKIMQSIKLS